MHETTIRIVDDTAYAAATAGNDATIELWCNEHCDLLRVHGRADGVVDYVEQRVGIQDQVRDGDEQLVVTKDCLKQHEEGYIETYVQRHSCLLLPPIRYERGTKCVRVLALNGQRLTEFFRDLSDDFEVTVDSKRTINVPVSGSPLVRAELFVPDLSPRQHEVLLEAWEQGYYEIPRGITTSELADSFGLDRRTVENHIRRAEQKLVNAIADHLS